MRYIKTFEIFQDFEKEDFIIGLPYFPCNSRDTNMIATKNFVTTNVGEVVETAVDMIKIKYDINPNSPENGYILDGDMKLISYKKYFRFATPEEINLQNAKNSAIKYNI